MRVRWRLIIGLMASILLSLFLSSSIVLAQSSPTFTINRSYFTNGPTQSGVYTYQFTVQNISQSDYLTLTYQISMDSHIAFGNDQEHVKDHANWSNNQVTVAGTFSYTPGKSPTSIVSFRFMRTNGLDSTTLAVVDEPKTAQLGAPAGVPGGSTSGSGTGGTNANTSAKLGSVDYKVTSNDNTNAKLAISYTITPSTNLNGLKIKLYRKDGTLVGSVAAQASGSIPDTIKSTDTDIKYTVQLVNSSTVLDQKEVPVNLSQPNGNGTTGSGSGGPTASPNTTSSCDSNGGGFDSSTGTFCDTVFGKNLTAGQYFLKAYYWAVGVAIAGAAAAIVFAGYKYVLSRGNPSELSQAKEIIISAIVGLVLLLLSYTILKFLGINVA